MSISYISYIYTTNWSSCTTNWADFGTLVGVMLIRNKILDKLTFETNISEEREVQLSYQVAKVLWSGIALKCWMATDKHK